MERPEWWDWELAFTSHVEIRMEERGFTEVDLRRMLEDATEVEPSSRPGRWMISTRLRGSTWRVIVEPDQDELALYIVTAYRRDTR